MIDLRQKGLPNIITVDGEPYKIQTDFRFWLDFNKLIKAKIEIKYFLHLFKNQQDLFKIRNWQEAYEQLVKFYYNPNSTPHGDSQDTEIIYDFIQDGEYIYASFLAAYGIDLTEADMHWWKFQALFRSLPEDSKMRQIMGFRGWKRDTSKNPESRYQKAKDAWRLVSKEEQDQKESALQQANALLYNAIYKPPEEVR